MKLAGNQSMGDGPGDQPEGRRPWSGRRSCAPEPGGAYLEQDAEVLTRISAEFDAQRRFQFRPKIRARPAIAIADLNGRDDQRERTYSPPVALWRVTPYRFADGVTQFPHLRLAKTMLDEENWTGTAVALGREPLRQEVLCLKHDPSAQRRRKHDIYGSGGARKHEDMACSVAAHRARGSYPRESCRIGSNSKARLRSQ